MAFRNPLYLNYELLSNLADYYEIELPAEAQVTRKNVAERTNRAGVSKVVDVGGERVATEEVTEVFNRQARPVRAMNDVVDGLIQDGGLVDLAGHPSLPVGQRDVVQLEGELALSPATEIGAVMAVMIPKIMMVVGTPGLDEEAIKTEAAREIILGGGAGAGVPHIFSMDTEVPDTRVVVVADPAYLFGSTKIDDLDGEHTVLATVDQLVGVDRRYSLERHLLPGVNRSVRRAIQARGGVSSMIASSSGLLGRNLDPEELQVNGPALVLTTVAIY